MHNTLLEKLMEIPEQAQISRSFAKYFLVGQWANNCIKLRKATVAAKKKMVGKMTKSAQIFFPGPARNHQNLTDQ
jgi:hypothetical protein